MGNQATNRLGSGAGLVVKVKVSVQLLAGSAAVTISYLMYRCMESCAALLQAMHNYH